MGNWLNIWELLAIVNEIKNRSGKLKNWTKEYNKSLGTGLQNTLSWFVKNSAWLEQVPTFGKSYNKICASLGYHAQIQLLQYAACPFNYTEDLGRSTAGSVNYEMGSAVNVSLLKWLYIFSLTYKSPLTISK